MSLYAFRFGAVDPLGDDDDNLLEHPYVIEFCRSLGSSVASGILALSKLYYPDRMEGFSWSELYELSPGGQARETSGPTGEVVTNGLLITGTVTLFIALELETGGTAVPPPTISSPAEEAPGPGVPPEDVGRQPEGPAAPGEVPERESPADNPEQQAASIAERDTDYRSKINRALDKGDREQYWKDQAEKNPGDYAPEQLERMKNGRAPIGPDGVPMERHHSTGDPDGPIEPMTRRDHREGENYRRNHPWLWREIEP